MRMKFYRLQMKSGSDGETITDEVLAQNRITADEDYARDRFNYLKYGDLVMVHKGAFPEALVKVVKKIPDGENPKPSFGIDYTVEIFSKYKEAVKEFPDLDELWGNMPYQGTFAQVEGNNDTYRRINKWYSLINNKKAMNNIINILEYKLQIILQGPPGTGKTFSAQDLAFSLVFGKPIAVDFDGRRKCLEELTKSEQFKLVQFHPSYSYEDFVRGITAKPRGKYIDYKTEDRIFLEFADKAQKNIVDHNKSEDLLSIELWVKAMFDEFKLSVQEYIHETGKYDLNKTGYIEEIEDDAFRYTGPTWPNIFRMKFNDIITLYLKDIRDRQGIIDSDLVSGLARNHSTYFLLALNKFREFIEKSDKKPVKAEKIALKKYVLIIDEINRANIPSVLGELIYALEYRGQVVESMYALEDGSRSFVIPKNLFILGTMNTADRSVGHIDYAIRRRFAFVDVLPKLSVVEAYGNENAVRLFKEVADIFCKDYMEDSSQLEKSTHLAGDFEPTQVMIGHSYFLTKDDLLLDLKLRQEIIPILMEYVKDGVLIDSIELRNKINALHA